MSDVNPRGQFIWHELMTTDLRGSTAFYRTALGWEHEPSKANPDYHVFRRRGQARGGAMQWPKAECEQGARTGWMPYIGTLDLDATVSAAVVNGGGVIKGAMEIPAVGRFAVLRDPQGAVFGAFELTDRSMHDAGYAWHELATTDIDAAFAFYRSLFGWHEIRRMDMGANGTYLIFGLGDQQVGGVYPKQPVAPQAYWLAYTDVAEVNAAVASATGAGAKVILPPMQVPGGGWVSQYIDPQGAIFAVHAMPAAVAAAAPKAPAKAKAKAKAKVKAKPKAKAKAKVKAKSRRPVAAARRGAVKRKPAGRKPARRAAAKRRLVRRPARKK